MDRCLFISIFRPTREYFSHLVTLPLPVKDCKFCIHRAVRVLQRATPTVTRGIRLYWSSPSTRDTHLMPMVCQWSRNYLLNDSGLSRLGHKRPTFRLPGERSNPLHHNFEVSLAVLTSLLFFEPQKNGFLRAKDTGHRLTSHPTDIKQLHNIYAKKMYINI